MVVVEVNSLVDFPALRPQDNSNNTSPPAAAGQRVLLAVVRIRFRLFAFVRIRIRLFTFYADPDPAPPRPPFVSVHGPLRFYFEPPKLLNYDFNADPDPDPAFHHNVDPNPASKNNADYMCFGSGFTLL